MIRSVFQCVSALGRARALRRAVVAGAAGLLLGGGLAHAEGSSAPLNLAQYKGQVVYLDFWASWCGPCKISFPYMEKMTAYYSNRKFVVIAVNLDHSRASADAFLNQVGADLPVVYDPKGAIASKFDVKEMPTSVLIGRDGRVRYVHKGFFQDKMPVYEAHISELLNEN